MTWTSDSLSAELDGPGLVTAIEVGEQAMVCLIPASLPLPAWYLEPSESEQSRLQTLAMEWSINLLPEDLTAGQFSTVALTNIKHEVTSWEPCEWAAAIELLVHEEPADEKSSDAEASAAEAETDETETGDVVNDESSSAGAPPVAVLYLVWPVSKPPFPSEEEASSAVESVPQESAAEQPAPRVSKHSQLLRKLPVTISVRLAEKKIEVGTLLSLTPGALITSCEDLLELCINDRCYCQGEAVKIGEKFGLKINSIGVVEQREPQVLNT